MSNASPSTAVGIGTIGLLGIVFIVLTLTGFISWSWLWVTLPFWAGLAVGLAIFLFWLLFALVAVVVRERAAKKRRTK